jgi:hypothetical protein
MWRLLAAAFLSVAATAAPAAAQGKSPLHRTRDTPSATSSPATSEGQQLYSGSWIDDASLVPAGSVFMSFSAAAWSASGLRQFDVPVINMAAGVAPRANIGASVPFYYASDATGASARGVGEVFLYTKILLREPPLLSDGVAIAIAPVVEITRDSTATSGAATQTSWAAPVSIELRHGQSRIYASGGYFSRGALFGSVGVSATARRVTLLAQIADTYATSAQVSTTTPVNRRETDVGVGASVTLTPTSAMYVAVGRSYTGTPPAATWVTGGIALMLSGR